MTGYGRSKLELKGKKYTIEIRTLNSKGFDVNLRLHHMFREREMDIRQLIASCVVRGKADININNDPGDESKNGELNPELIIFYMKQLKAISANLELSDERLFELSLQLPNIAAGTQDALDPKDWPLVKKAIDDVCADLKEFRIREGRSLKEDLEIRNSNILKILEKVTILDPDRVVRAKERLQNALSTYSDEEVADANRLEQELIYYVEKLDINEEVTRLRSHCSYFTECMDSNNEEKGKKLAFISQEMGREINTIGSKSYHAEMQKLVVDMKDELEKIKEQLNNVL